MLMNCLCMCNVLTKGVRFRTKPVMNGVLMERSGIQTTSPVRDRIYPLVEDDTSMVGWPHFRGR